MTNPSVHPSPADTGLGALLEAARAGERAALDEIVRTLTPLLWHTARAQGLDAESSSDVVQNTWLTLLRSLSDIQTPAALTGWLVTVAKREAWRTARARRAERTADSADVLEIADTAPGPEQSVVENEAHRRLWSLLRQLPERCQRLLRIVAYVPRPDYTEISDQFGMPRGTIGPTRGRCLAKLRRLLEADGGGTP
ncbi:MULTISPECIES: sigma-70 family RNA polymerase sigma factor [unclassified Amycolatopsis]|uniref:RNA polymerase sigma factor n=1 Tax=unclassified Amycolatopsis TaxID=2618356 RepID=UPI002876FA55|nr:MULTISPECIES: sigma-70 family RNA polymerase sigma factor [unclassified Amycolatopsis]MDS0134290.1 sigma-70 family RNA polymerase sigma factor [Amycolatopsis sp. 505]MDS0149611.1 sigma-70 family RNA polymerase sigma factor [Amycolatopsis sp. CM201R]